MFRPRVLATKGGLAVLVQITFGCTGPNTNHPNPESCKDVRYNAIQATGEHPADGTYTVYGLGELQAPWQVYCDGMSGTSGR